MYTTGEKRKTKKYKIFFKVTPFMNRRIQTNVNLVNQIATLKI